MASEAVALSGRSAFNTEDTLCSRTGRKSTHPVSALNEGTGDSGTAFGRADLLAKVWASNSAFAKVSVTHSDFECCLKAGMVEDVSLRKVRDFDSVHHFFWLPACFESFIFTRLM